jgi:hypothetical protein
VYLYDGSKEDIEALFFFIFRMLTLKSRQRRRQIFLFLFFLRLLSFPTLLSLQNHLVSPLIIIVEMGAKFPAISAST